jgi:hypothetical protein
MPRPPPVRSPLRVWVAALGMLAAMNGCGRVGYDRVAVTDGPPSDRQDLPGDRPAELASDSGPALDLGSAEAMSPDAGAPDAPVDVVDAPPDTAPAIDRAVDRPPDQAFPWDTPVPSPNPPVFTSAGSGVGAGNQLSYMFDAGNGSNRYLVVSVALETETRNVTAVSFGGRPLTRLGAEVSGACGNYLYGLANPPVGSNQLSVTLSDSSDIVVVASSFTGVQQTAVQGTFVSGTGSEGPASVVVPSAPGEHVVDSLCMDEGNGSPRVGEGQTERGRRTASTFEAVQSTEPGATSVTMSWTFSDTVYGWASTAVSLKPAN